MTTPIILDIETTGLYPSPAAPEVPDTIVAIGALDKFGLNVFTMPHETFISCPLDAIEKEIITNFGAWLAKTEESPFVTYNGKSFDIPFITTKLFGYGDQASQEYAEVLLGMCNIDLIGYAKFVTGRRLTKDDACRKLANLYVPRKTEGLWNARIYKNAPLLTVQDHLEMQQHNAVDLASTARLYEVVRRFPDFSGWQRSEAEHPGDGEGLPPPSPPQGTEEVFHA